MSRRSWLLIGVFSFGAVVAVAVTVIASVPDRHVPDASRAVVSPTSPIPKPPDLSYLSHALNSDAKDKQALALAVELRASYSKQARPLIPVGRRITIDDRTFKAGGPTGAVVEAAVTGGERFRLLLVWEGNQWLIFDTTPIG